jgi:hypothetical protein
MADETTSNETKAPAAAKPKKEKPPAVEDKPFADFVSQDFIPALQKGLAAQGVDDLTLTFEKQSLPVPGLEAMPACWQVIGNWQGGQRQFMIGFSKEDITAPKFYCAADYGTQPSTLESFMIDERKTTLDLLVHYTVQRLNGQKWLLRN